MRSSRDKNKYKKQKSCKFSTLKIKGVDKNKNCHFKIYLPGGNNPCWSYFDCLINRPGRFSVSKFMDKLLNHAKISSSLRNKYYL